MVKDRIDSGEGISFTEFSYQTFQAHDWLHLYRKYNCTVQVGSNGKFTKFTAVFFTTNPA